MRPQLRFSIPGRYSRLSRTPLSTLTLKEPQPVVVGDFVEGLGLEDAEVVDEDVDVGNSSESLAASSALPRSAATPEICAGDGLADFGDGGLHALGGAAVDDDRCAFGGQVSRDGEADAGGRAGDEGELGSELEVHA